MSSAFQRELKKLSRHLVLIHRPAGMSSLFGFVVGSTDALVLLHSFDSEVFCLNGYDVIRQCDIHSYCFFDDPRYWRHQAIRRLKIRPALPIGISLSSIQQLLSSVAARYPLLSVHRETPLRTTTFVGPVMSMAEHTFTIEDSDYFGRWTGPRRLRYADVTLVCFEGGFLQASAMTARKIRGHKPQKFLEA